MALVILGLVSTLALATELPWAKDKGAGICMAAVDAEGKTVVVLGEGLKVGETIDCLDHGNMIACQAVGVASAPLPPSAMTCAKDDGAGPCVAAAHTAGKTVVVVGTGVKRGESMACVDRSSVIECQAL